MVWPGSSPHIPRGTDRGGTELPLHSGHPKLVGSHEQAQHRSCPVGRRARSISGAWDTGAAEFTAS